MHLRRVFIGLLKCLSAWMSLTASLYAVTETSSVTTPLRYRSGVHNAFNQHALKPKQLDVLLKSLRKHSGWPQLDFDKDGFLICPDEAHFIGGSAAARTLLTAAMTAPIAFDLENHQRVTQIAFARLSVPVQFRSMASGHQISAFPLQFDFADFDALQGQAEVLTAFDVGFVFLHELAHGVWGLRDAHSEADKLGECERYINQIRRELQLPERQHYAARTRQYGLDVTGGLSSYAELLFTRVPTSNESPKPKHFYLQWEVRRVGRSAEQKT